MDVWKAVSNWYECVGANELKCVSGFFLSLVRLKSKGNKQQQKKAQNLRARDKKKKSEKNAIKIFEE